MKTRRDVMDWILDLEERYAVDRWEVNDIHVWPLIRKALYFQLINQIDDIKGNEGSGRKKSGRLSFVYRTIKSAAAALLFAVKPKRNAEIFASAPHFRSDLGEYSYNKYFDVMIDYLESKGSRGILVEYSKGYGDKKLYRNERVVFLSRFIPFFAFLERFSTRRNVPQLEGYDRFLSEIEKNEFIGGKPSRFTTQWLDKATRNVFAYSRAFGFLFWKFRPKVAFSLSYYNKEMWGLSHAASRSTVLSIDMQHGSQGKLHFAYANWKKMPKNGFEVMPKYFWCWDEGSAGEIRTWSEGKGVHVIAGGNPWIELLRRLPVEYPGVGNMILFTMQPLGELLDKYIIDAIKQTSGEFKWWLRLHPRQISSMPDLEALLSREGIRSDVDIDLANTIPLPYLLDRARVHLSKFSGSIQEGLIIGTPTLIIHSIGSEVFSSDVFEGRAEVCLSEDAVDLVRAIRSLASRRGTLAGEPIAFEKHFTELLHHLPRRT